jgi:hypothetical protein
MAQKREGYAPFSIERQAGVQSATVNGTIDVVQEIRPTLTTGFIDERGDWKGLKSSEEQFHSFGVDEAIANGASILAPQIASGTIWPLDMTGYNDLFIAIKPSNGGNFGIVAVMGPNDLSFANLRPVNPDSTLRGQWNGIGNESDLENLFLDASEALTVDVWNIFMIQGRLSDQKLLQFQITNNSGGESDIETAFMRLV